VRRHVGVHFLPELAQLRSQLDPDVVELRAQIRTGALQLDAEVVDRARDPEALRTDEQAGEAEDRRELHARSVDPRL